MRQLFQYRAYVIGFFVVLISASLYYALHLDFHHNIEDFYPTDDPDLKFLEYFHDKVAPDDNYYLVALHRKQGVFDSTFLNKVHRFTLDCREVPHAIDAESITTLYQPIKTPMGIIHQPLVHLDQPERFKKDSIELIRDPRWVHRFISEDGQTLVVGVMSKDSLQQKEAEEFDNAIHDLLDQYDFSEFHVAGKPNVQNVFVHQIKREVVLFVILGVIVLSIILALIFQTWRGVVIPMVSVLAGLIFFLGILGLAGMDLNLLSTMFPTIMLIVGMSDVIHIMNKYIEEQQEGRDRYTAMSIAIREIGWATLLTSFTTAVGFCALITSKIQPVRIFGLTAAFGVLLAYGTVIVFTTSMLLYFDHHQLVSGRIRKYLKKSVLAPVYLFVERRPRWIVTGSVVVLLLSFWGIHRINTNTYLLTDIPRHSKIWQDFLFIEKEMGGARSFEMAVLPGKGHNAVSLPVLEETDKLTDYLSDRRNIAGISSPVMLYKSIHQALNGGQRKAYQLPGDSAAWQQCTRIINKAPSNEVKALMSKDRSIGRVSGKIQDIGSNRISAINEEINRWIDRNIDTTVVDFRHTGTSLVIDNNNKYLRQSLFSGLAFAFLFIGVALWLLFRDWRLVVVSYVPNLLPLLIAGGVMGWTGITLKASTAIIFTVGYGIAVDDTIHFLSRLKLEQRKGQSIQQALYQTVFGTGQAIVLTSIILISGFLVLLFSDFTTTRQEGILISVTLLSALVADLTLLPVCLKWLYKR